MRWALVWMAGAAALGCAPPNPAGPALGVPKPSEAFQGVQCDAVRPQTEPDLMAWDPGSRANLSRLRKQGVVAVRYAQSGCNVELEVLSNCIGPGAAKAYGYEAYSATQSKLARNAQELYAELPIGAARLTGKLKGNRALRTDYSLVGTAALPAGKTYQLSDLTGDCSKATHVVSVVYLGGFAMVAGEARELEAAGTVFGAGAGTKTGAEAERLDSEGEASACDKAKKDGLESTLCAVPLRIGLMALSGAVAPPPLPAPAPAPAPLPAVAPVTQPPAIVTVTPPAAPPAPAPLATPPGQPASPAGNGHEFDRGAAMATLAAASAAVGRCKTRGGPTGRGHVKVTFAPGGNVISAQVDSPPYAGTATGGCIAGAFRGARVPAFDGDPVSVGKAFSIDP